MQKTQNPQAIPLNQAQKTAAEAKNGPLLIVAGAGTGKTKTLTSRINYLIKTGTAPDRICAITFTNKAAKEMLNRVDAMRNGAVIESTTQSGGWRESDGGREPGGGRKSYGGQKSGGGQKSSHEPLISTFHSLGARILRKECRFLGRAPNFAIFDDHDSFDLIKKAVKSILPKPPKDENAGYGDIKQKINKKESPSFFAQKISEIKNRDGMLDELRAIGRVNHAVGSAVADAVASRTKRGERLAGLPRSTADAKTANNILSVFEKYEAALARNNAFDFDDLIEKVVSLFRKHPDVLKKYQTMFDAILVDEYQDINPKQCELVTLLAKEHRNLSVVGDDEQTIYSWRYANIKTFLDFDKDWEKAHVYFLEENYRSTGNIIRAAGSVVKNNSFRTPKNLWTRNPEGDRITLFEAWGENEEAEWIAQEIMKRRMGGDVKNKNRVATDAKANVDATANSDGTAVLYRTNAQSRAVEQALIRRDIPYKIFGGLKFYERREVKDAIAALRYASNANDEVARERLEKNLTKRKFAEFQLKLKKLAIGNPMVDGGNNNVGNTGVSTGVDAESSNGKMPGASPLEMMKLFLDTFNYMDYLEENFINAEEREENIAELVAFAAEFQTLPDFLEKLSLLQATDDAREGVRENEKQRRGREVILTTIHLAKGLEFDTVFIAGAAEGLLPHGRSLENDASIEEERRLMYVAMTRARKNLIISFYGIPSRFIAEIPDDCIKIADAGARGVGEGETGKIDSNAGEVDDEEGEEEVFFY